jgi:hypothetical protein
MKLRSGLNLGREKKVKSKNFRSGLDPGRPQLPPKRGKNEVLCLKILGWAGGFSRSLNVLSRDLRRHMHDLFDQKFFHCHIKLFNIKLFNIKNKVLVCTGTVHAGTFIL